MEFSWNTILEYLGRYYGFLYEGLEALMQHQTILNPFEDFTKDIDNDDDDDNNDDYYNGQQDVNNVNDSIENMEDNDPIRARPQSMYEKPRTSMEGTQSSIKKLMEDILEDAIGGGIEVLNHLHFIVFTVAKNIHRICIQKQTNTSHPQAIFFIIDNGDGNSILHKKDWRERMMGSKKKKRTCCTDK